MMIKQMHFLKPFGVIALMCLVLVGHAVADSVKQDSTSPNILFISVDDLRPELNCYGAEHIISPNIDRLASQGVLFERAYCNYPVCGASRASIMTGLRPTPNRFTTYYTRADEDAPGVIDLAATLKNAGYRTVNNGKIYHNEDDNKDSWDEIFRPNEFCQYFTERNLALKESSGKKGYPYEATDVPDEEYQGGKVAQKAIDELRLAKETGEPVFITAGFTKPHLPFNCPQKYWDLYPEETIAFPYNDFVPENAPRQSIHTFGELRSYYGIPAEGPIPDLIALNMIRGYYACVSFTDAMIGRILAALDELEMWDNTIVVLWGDHGWQLAEHTLWCKHANYNTSLQVPLVVVAPGKSSGKTTTSLVEFVDIYPTLCELTGIDLPSHLEGTSMVTLLDNPRQSLKKAVFSRYGKGESIRTERYLYTEWNNSDGSFAARMLYDHKNDPDENVNISEYPENAKLVKKMSEMLHAGWKEYLP